MLAEIAGIKDEILKRRKHGFTSVFFNFKNMNEDFWKILKNYVDMVKFCACISFFIDDDTFNSRISFLKSLGISLNFDVSYATGKISVIKLARYLKSIGFDFIEFNVIPGKESYIEEFSLIDSLKSLDLKVIVKITKPYKERKIRNKEIVEVACMFLEKDIEFVSLEGGILGRDTLIYDSNGNIIWDRVIDLVNAIPLEKILFEAPLWKQQAELIAEFGPNIGISNVNPEDVLYLEALRYGLSTGHFPETTKIELTPSAKFVYYVLKKLGPMDAPQIAYTTGLPGRTVREAIKILNEKGLILEVKKVGKRRVWKAV